MSYEFERAGRKLFLVKNHPTSQRLTSMRGAERPLLTDFPAQPAKVAVINVDTAGKEVPLFSQEGI